jgi:hypothetical protein
LPRGLAARGAGAAAARDILEAQDLSLARRRGAGRLRRRRRRGGQRVLGSGGLGCGRRLRRAGREVGSDAGRGGSLELVADGARAIDDHELAMDLQGRDLLVGLDDEPLEQERRIHPRPIEIRDKHADLEVRGVDLGRHRCPAF